LVQLLFNYQLKTVNAATVSKEVAIKCTMRSVPLNYKRSNMILILSEKYDSQTDTVMDWLQFYGHDITRINDHDSVTVEWIKMENGTTTYKLKIVTELGRSITIHSETIDCVWYRRGDYIIPHLNRIQEGVEPRFFKSFQDHVKKNNDVIKSFLHHFHKEKQVGNYFDNSTNKLLNLDLAQRIGFCVPETIITSEKKHLVEFLASHTGVVTKGIRVNGFEMADELTCSCLTKEITQEIAWSFPEEFAPSLFQEMIPKILELRIFYFKGKLFTAAMLTQANPQTSLDFRNYDGMMPTRTIPFVLPPDISAKIRSFMLALNMTTGSLDLIVTPEGKYYFLEVNPAGQFGFISIWCNAILEREIAKELIYTGHGRA
jgi:ATP-GRASP peptide maturase of grasp-with-spasm system